MNQYKKVQVILLPIIKEKSSKNQLAFNRKTLTKLIPNVELRTYYKFQEMYFISDDEIKEGDWCYDEERKLIFQFKSATGLKNYIKSKQKFVKKIIATTNTVLSRELRIQVGDDSNYIDVKYPQPTQKFVEKYIEYYNKNEIITEVLVEYCQNLKVNSYHENGDPNMNDSIYVDYIKINSKDNTITVKTIKDTWNREELKVLFKKHEEDVIKYINGSGPTATPSFNDKWFEENLL